MASLILTLRGSFFFQTNLDLSKTKIKIVTRVCVVSLKESGFGLCVALLNHYKSGFSPLNAHKYTKVWFLIVCPITQCSQIHKSLVSDCVSHYSMLTNTQKSGFGLCVPLLDAHKYTKVWFQIIVCRGTQSSHPDLHDEVIVKAATKKKTTRVSKK